MLISESYKINDFSDHKVREQLQNGHIILHFRRRKCESIIMLVVLTKYLNHLLHKEFLHALHKILVHQEGHSLLVDERTLQSDTTLHILLLPS